MDDCVSLWKKYNFAVSWLGFESILLPLSNIFCLEQVIFPLCALISSFVKEGDDIHMTEELGGFKKLT